MKTNPIPKGYHTITPYLAVKGIPALISFLRDAFGAEEMVRHALPDGTILNAELKIGDSMLMLGEVQDQSKARTAMLHLYVVDVDSVYNHAVKAGGKSVLIPTDQFYGDRNAAIDDPCGNQWWIASRKVDLTAEEITIRMSKLRG